MMEFFNSDFGRLLSFTVVTVLEILLGFFLLFYGSDTLKFFAVLLLFIELFAIQKIYFYFVHLNRYLRS
jgi:hypothetical protein